MTPTPPPHPPLSVLALSVRADVGGGPEHLYQLSRALGDQVRLFIACPDEPPYRARFAGLPNLAGLFDLPHRRFSVRSLIGLARQIRQQGITLIHSHGKGAGIYGRLLSAMTGRPAVHTFHGLHIGSYGRAGTQAYLMIERILGLWTQAAICVSQGEYDQIRAAGLMRAAKLRVVENGVVVPAETVRPPAADSLRIVAVSRYDQQKNAELIVDIAEALRRRIGDRFGIEVLGTGERMAAVQASVAARGLQGAVRLSGPVAQPRAIFRTADVFLSTSRWEGMPLAVLEAMSEGLAVAATDVVGNRDVVEMDRTGLLYPSEDAEAGAEALIALTDPQRRDRLGAAARHSVQDRFSVDRMARETKGIYLSAAQSSAQANE